MENLIPLLLASFCFLAFGGVVALVVWLVIWSRRKERQRTEAMRAVAGQLGLPFYPQGDPVLISALSGFKLFSQGSARSTSNMLHGQTDDVEVGIFEYQ